MSIVSPILDIYAVTPCTLKLNQMMVTVDVNEVAGTPVLVDSGAGGSFINVELVNCYNLPTQDLPIPAMAYNVDRTPNKRGGVVGLGSHMMSHMTT